MGEIGTGLVVWAVGYMFMGGVLGRYETGFWGDRGYLAWG